MKKTALKFVEKSPAAEKQGVLQDCPCDEHIENSRAMLAVALGLLAKDSNLKLDYLEMLGLQRILKDASNELTKAFDLHVGSEQ